MDNVGFAQVSLGTKSLTAPCHRRSRPDFVINITPADLGLLRQEPEEFSIWELNRYIHDLKRKGLDPGGYLVDRDLKYAMPLACLIMVALGIGSASIRCRVILASDAASASRS